MTKSLPAPEQVTDLVWLATGFIGDLVLATAAMELARRKFPRAKQHVVTTPAGEKVLAGVEGVASRVVFDKRAGTLSPLLAARRALRKALPPERRKTAVLLQPHLSFRSSLLARLTGLPTITFDETVGGGHAAARVPRVALLHEAARISLLLEPLAIARADVVAARPKLTPLPLETTVGEGDSREGGGDWQARVAAHAAAGGKVVAVAPGSVWGTKRWPSERYADVAARLVSERKDVLLVMIGSEAERDATRTVAAAVTDSSRVLDLAGKTSLDDLRRLFPRLALLIANDSSPIHYAAAFAVPTVAVFGATVPAMGFGPLAEGSVVVDVQGLPCRPCGAHGPMACPLGHFRCMLDLGAERVLAAALARL